MKNILFASSECVPFIKTGGLADVVGSLPKEFDKEKYDVRVVLPKYTCMKQEWKDRMEYAEASAVSFSGFLAHYTLLHPYQWFNFFEFWSNHD